MTKMNPDLTVSVKRRRLRVDKIENKFCTRFDVQKTRYFGVNLTPHKFQKAIQRERALDGR